jgi:hypothetical protein
MPFLRFGRARRRSFPSMPHVRAAMPPIDTRQIERAVERGRARMESLAEQISNETVGELLDDLRHEAAPIAARAMPILERAAERATGRRRKSRKPKVALVILGLLALAGVVAYLLWQRRDEEPAFLMPQPDEPDLTPAQTPPATPWAPPAPSAGPVAPDVAPEQPAGDPSVDEPPASPADPAPSREFVSSPRAIFGLGDRDDHEERSGDARQALPDTARSTFAPAPVQLPSSPRQSWLPR